jgi:hypothetical protein
LTGDRWAGRGEGFREPGASMSTSKFHERQVSRRMVAISACFAAKAGEVAGRCLTTGALTSAGSVKARPVTTKAPFNKACPSTRRPGWPGSLTM